MTTQGSKLFGCPVCGFRVTGSEDSCPRCGTKYGSDTRFECPFCGELVPASSPRCPSCRVSYEEFSRRVENRHSEESVDSLLTEIISMEAAQVKKEDKRLSCPRCSWLLDGTEEKCPKCGAGFLDEVSYQCPICAAMVRADAARCDECGALFAAGGEPEAQPPAEEQPASVPAEVPEAAMGMAELGPMPEAVALMPEPVQAAEPSQPEPVPQPEPERAAEVPSPEPAAVPEPEPQPAEAAPEEPATQEPPAEPGPAQNLPAPAAAPKRKLKTRKVKMKA